MFSKVNKNFFITALVIGLIIVSLKYIDLLNKYKWQQDNANINFQSSLSVASTFGSNLISDEEFNNYYYNDAMSKIETASQLVQFTAYSESNKGLSVALDNLCTVMKDSKYKERIL